MPGPSGARASPNSPDSRERNRAARASCVLRSRVRKVRTSSCLRRSASPERCLCWWRATARRSALLTYSRRSSGRPKRFSNPRVHGSRSATASSSESRPDRHLLGELSRDARALDEEHRDPDQDARGERRGHDEGLEPARNPGEEARERDGERGGREQGARPGDSLPPAGLRARARGLRREHRHGGQGDRGECGRLPAREVPSRDGCGAGGASGGQRAGRKAVPDDRGPRARGSERDESDETRREERGLRGAGHRPRSALRRRRTPRERPWRKPRPDSRTGSRERERENGGDGPDQGLGAHGRGFFRK